MHFLRVVQGAILGDIQAQHFIGENIVKFCKAQFYSSKGLNCFNYYRS